MNWWPASKPSKPCRAGIPGREGRVSPSPSRLVSRLAQLERTRTANRDAVKVITRYIDSDPQEVERRATAAGATGAVVVVVQSLASERR